MNVVIAGGTGSLGRRLAGDLRADGHDVVILTRRRRDDLDHRQIEWDGRTAGDWASELEGSAVINLAGALVDRRPTAGNIELLRRSRVEPTLALVGAAAANNRAPGLWMQMSTLGIYGDAGAEIIDETHPPAAEPPQMAGVATAWEASADEARAERMVVLRTGIVLERGTPAMNRLTRLTRFGLGGRIGPGSQWVSWIHVDDFVNAMRCIIDSPSMEGVYHLTAPHPVQNTAMMQQLRAALGRPWAPPTPTPLVRFGAALMRTDPALALTGRRCVPRRLLDHGFTFEYPTFEEAIAELVGS